jgi:hypothetical protein
MNMVSANNNSKFGQKSNNTSKKNPALVGDEINSNNLAMNETNDDDLLDISDTELIRASQVVESQLKFTNNVHHTTSNAMTIFSQFNNNNNHHNNYNNNNNLNQNEHLMPMLAPTTTSYGFPTPHECAEASLSHQIDELKNELFKMKGENMQKDGEVKILRDKLKRQEQESQKMRNERMELVKRLQQQQEEAKKNLQKQIEFKDLENHLKTQEIFELTMKYKVLESTVKKSHPSIVSSTPSTSHTSVLAPNAHLPIQLVNTHDENSSSKKQNTTMVPPSSVQSISSVLSSSSTFNSKAMSIKRLASNSVSLSDNENENLTPESKRPALLSTSMTVSDNATNKPQQQQLLLQSTNFENSNKPSSSTPRAPLSPFQNNSSLISNASDSKSSTNYVQAINKQALKPVLVQPSSLVNASPIGSFDYNKPKMIMQTPKTGSSATIAGVSYKRTCKLNIKSRNFKSIDNKDINEKVYNLIEIFSESTNMLNKINTSLVEQSNQQNIINKSIVTGLYINKLFVNLCNLNGLISLSLSNGLATELLSKSQTIFTEPICSTHRSQLMSIEQACHQLNDELFKLIKLCLTEISTLRHKTTHVGAKQSNEAADDSISISLVDLACLSFDICFNLFVFRADLAIIQLSNAIEESSKEVQAKKILNEECFCKLIELKQGLFFLINRMIKSISFSSSSGSSHSNGKSSSINSISLNSAGFNSSSLTKKPNSSNDSQLTSSSTSSSSSTSPTSSSSYSTLKILNSLICCFNQLLYKPLEAKLTQKTANSTEISTWFYLFIVDSMHNIFVNLNVRYFAYFLKCVSKRSNLDILSNKATSTVTQTKSNTGVSENLQESNKKLIDLINGFNKKINVSNTISMYEDDEEPCLFQSFFDKLIKYFGDVVYTIEVNECHSSINCEQSMLKSSGSSQSIHSNLNSSSSNSTISRLNTNSNAPRGINCVGRISGSNSAQQISIITSIGIDESVQVKTPGIHVPNKHQQTSKKVENESINSNVDMQSQMSLDEDESYNNELKKIANGIEVSTPNEYCDLETGSFTPVNNQPNSLLSRQNETESVSGANMSCIRFLHTKLLNNFVDFLRNYELHESYETTYLIKTNALKSMFDQLSNTGLSHEQNLTNPTNLNNDYEYCYCYETDEDSKNECLLVTNIQRCTCVKDMLESFLVIIDHQFNEKFMNGAKLALAQRHFNSTSSCCVIHKIINKQSILKQANPCQDNLLNNINLMEIDSLLVSKDRLTRFINGSIENENRNQVNFLLMIKCLNILVSLFKSSNQSYLNQMQTRMQQQSIQPLQYKLQAHLEYINALKQQKIKFYDSFKDDYRLKNFACLYTLCESNFDQFLNTITESKFNVKKPKTEPTLTNNTLTTISDASANCKNDLPKINYTRSLVRAFIDCYFTQQ